MPWGRNVVRVVGIALFISWTLALEAQTNRGVIEGIWYDSGGGGVPGANVTLTSMDSGISITTTTNDAGFYRLADLAPGKYKVSFSVAGFSSFEITGIGVSAGKVARVDTQRNSWDLKRLAEKGDAKAQYEVGLMYLEGRGVGQDEKEGVKWLRMVAERDVAEAQLSGIIEHSRLKLGTMYANGSPVLQDDKEAPEWNQ